MKKQWENLYAKKVPSNEFLEGRCMGDYGWKDVQLSHTKDFREIAGIIPGGHKQPDKRNRYQNLNCQKYCLVWV